MQFVIANKESLIICLFLLSELLALNPWTKSSSVVHLLLNLSKSLYKLIMGKDAPVIEEPKDPTLPSA